MNFWSATTVSKDKVVPRAKVLNSKDNIDRRTLKPPPNTAPLQPPSSGVGARPLPSPSKTKTEKDTRPEDTPKVDPIKLDEQKQNKVEDKIPVEQKQEEQKKNFPSSYGTLEDLDDDSSQNKDESYVLKDDKPKGLPALSVGYAAFDTSSFNDDKQKTTSTPPVIGQNPYGSIDEPVKESPPSGIPNSFYADAVDIDSSDSKSSYSVVEDNVSFSNENLKDSSKPTGSPYATPVSSYYSEVSDEDLKKSSKPISSYETPYSNPAPESNYSTTSSYSNPSPSYSLYAESQLDSRYRADSDVKNLYYNSPVDEDIEKEPTNVEAYVPGVVYSLEAEPLSFEEIKLQEQKVQESTEEKVKYDQAIDSELQSANLYLKSSEEVQNLGRSLACDYKDKKGKEALVDTKEDEVDLKHELSPEFNWAEALQQITHAESWNDKFQLILELPDSPVKFQSLAKLAKDFVFTAETYGKVIISELGLASHQKTIKPMDVGGQAGGEKYIVCGIFFKFALDIFDIYGGDQYAIKAAGHDLKGLIQYYSTNTPGLHVPLMALIDYMGYRLIAITTLPVGKSTLKYGSADGGQTIHMDDPVLNKKMEEAGQKMNLKCHKVGLPLPGSIHRDIYGPVDIEAHHGHDNRYYVLDYARTFPPEKPTRATRTRKGIILYNLLRPELVKQFSVPLSSDAFTVWGKVDPEKDSHNKDVSDATMFLYKVVIPKFAEKLNSGKSQGDEKNERLDLVELLHLNGINLRHLGRVRRLANRQYRSLILIEMIARIVKNQIFSILRDSIKNFNLTRIDQHNIFFPSEEPAKKGVVDLFNLILGTGSKSSVEASEKFWKQDIKVLILYSYELALFMEEMNPDYHLAQNLNLVNIILRVCELAGIALSASSIEELNVPNSVQSFIFANSDIEDFKVIVRHMNLIDIAEAQSMFFQSMELAASGTEGATSNRILSLALKKFKAASRKMKFDTTVIINLGFKLIENSKKTRGDGNDSKRKEDCLDNAMTAFQTANIILDNSSGVSDEEEKLRAESLDLVLLGIGKIFAERYKNDEALNYYGKITKRNRALWEVWEAIGDVEISKDPKIGMEAYDEAIEVGEIEEKNLRKGREPVKGRVWLKSAEARRRLLLKRSIGKTEGEVERQMMRIASLFDEGLRRSVDNDDGTKDLKEVLTTVMGNGGTDLTELLSISKWSDRLVQFLRSVAENWKLQVASKNGEIKTNFANIPGVDVNSVKLFMDMLSGSITNLNLSGCTALTEDHLCEIIENYKFPISEIYLSQIGGVTDNVLEMITKHWSKPIKVEGKGVEDNKPAAEGIKIISLNGCSKLTSAGIAKFLEQISATVEQVSLRDLPETAVDDQLLSKTLFGKLTKLSVLLIDGCPGLTDEGLNTFDENDENLPLLELLALGGEGTKLTAEGITKLIDSKKRITNSLQELSLTGISGLDTTAILSNIVPKLVPSLRACIMPSGATYRFNGQQGTYSFAASGNMNDRLSDSFSRQPLYSCRTSMNSMDMSEVSPSRIATFAQVKPVEPKYMGIQLKSVPHALTLSLYENGKEIGKAVKARVGNPSWTLTIPGLGRPLVMNYNSMMRKWDFSGGQTIFMTAFGMEYKLNINGPICMLVLYGLLHGVLTSKL